jgi:hypothetical protein
VTLVNRLGHRVHRATADRVVGAVLEQQPPDPREVVRGPVAPDQGGQGLRAALDQPLQPPPLKLLVHTGGVHVGQQIGACAGAKLPTPGLEIRRRRSRDVLGKRADVGLHRSDVVCLAEHRRHLAAGHAVVAAERQQHPITGGVRRDPLDPGGDVGRGHLGIGGRAQVLTCRVALDQVLGHHARAVGGLPAEGVAVDGAGDPPPDNGVLDSEHAHDLRHLSDVSELIGQVADGGCSGSEVGGARQPDLQVADMRLARGQELVQLGVPRSDRQPPGGRQPADVAGALRAGVKVVVEHRRLTVEMEMGELRSPSSRSSRSSMSWISNGWNPPSNGRYHSRSQCVWGRMTAVSGGIGRA